ncbi:MAG: GDP-mannose 4,6-dehydratase, partial [Dolichospermum sp.]
LEKDYTVIGCHRRSSVNNFNRIHHLIKRPNFILEEFDLIDPSGVNSTLAKYKPDELYNLAAQSHVGTSFKQPSATFEMNTLGLLNILEAVRHHSPRTKIYHASTSEMFGRNFSYAENGHKYQNEDTVMLPQSPYGIAKLASYHLVQIYRSSYNLFCCSGILFNHESPRRGENFVTKKITKYLGDYIHKRIDQPLQLGNLSAYRDWGHAKDYVRAMHLMLQQEFPQDFVVATGETHSVQEFVDLAFKRANLDPDSLVSVNPEFFRPAEVDYLCGDPSRAKEVLGWQPSISFQDLVNEMV